MSMTISLPLMRSFILPNYMTPMSLPRTDITEALQNEALALWSLSDIGVADNCTVVHAVKLGSYLRVDLCVPIVVYHTLP